MDLINKFKENVLQHDHSFEIEHEKTYYFFVQGKVGKAKYVYCQYGFRNNFQTSLDEKMELVAIVSDGTIYIINKFRLGVWQNGTTLPENTMELESYVNQINKYVEENVFAEFCKTLTGKDVTVNVERCMESAREFVILNRPYKSVKYHPMFDRADAAAIICGFIDTDSEATNRYESERSSWEVRKAYEDTINNFVYGSSGLCDESVAEQWEVKLANALAAYSDKNVTVTFELNGRTESEKMNAWTILSQLYTHGYFSYFDFANRKSGKRILEKLGATGWGSDKNALHCEEIKQITYGRKTIYER